jgi:hypothetical protein
MMRTTININIECLFYVFSVYFKSETVPGVVQLETSCNTGSIFDFYGVYPTLQLIDYGA